MDFLGGLEVHPTPIYGNYFRTIFKKAGEKTVRILKQSVIVGKSTTDAIELLLIVLVIANQSCQQRFLKLDASRFKLVGLSSQVFSSASKMILVEWGTQSTSFVGIALQSLSSMSLKIL